MSAIQNQILDKFTKGNAVQKLIFINIICFITPMVIGGIEYLVGSESAIVSEWFALDSSWNNLLIKPWTIITYGFLHADFIHFLVNMLILYYIGNLFLDYFTPKQLYNFYLMGTFFGGLLFLIVYNMDFGLDGPMGSILVGASAGVMAIIIGLATLIPYYSIRLVLFGYVKLWILAVIWLSIDIIKLSENTGGRLAHFGGALFGFLYVKMYQSGSLSIPIPNWFKKRESPLKTVHRNKERSGSKVSNKDDQDRINEILEKISKSGYDSLNKEEKEFLFKQGN